MFLGDESLSGAYYWWVFHLIGGFLEHQTPSIHNAQSFQRGTRQVCPLFFLSAVDPAVTTVGIVATPKVAVTKRISLATLTLYFQSLVSTVRSTMALRIRLSSMGRRMLLQHHKSPG